MFTVLYERSTGRYASCNTEGAAIQHDSATHVLVTVAVRPDRRLHVWDGGSGYRNATPQELQAYDQARTDAESSRALDGNKLLKAIALWAADRFGITPLQARAEIMAKYKSL